MNESILKSSWERHQEHFVLDIDTAQKLIAPYSHEKIASLSLLSNGCANSNYKVMFANGDIVALRIYMRDPSALSREQGIYQLIKTVIPVAEILYADASCNIIPYPFAVSQWVNGSLMRDLVFTHDEEAISSVTFDAGNYLAMLRAMKMPYGGFFQDDMQIRPFTPDEEYEAYVMHMLNDASVAKNLGNNLLHDAQQIVSQCCHILPEINEANLTHADFDPSNMLVVEENGKWKIAAILDWEFAYAGTYLLDIGMMLRYSHKLPDYYESSFIAGIKDAGPDLPADWKKSAKMMDLLCLLQLLQANPPEFRPYLNRDVVRLITHTIKTFPRT